MANFPISGKPIPEIDLRQITVSEWRALFDNSQPEHEGDKTLSKVSGMDLKTVRTLPLYDYRALFAAVIDKAGKPLNETDPKNSPGEST
jgi:hypothetical protein